MATAYLMTRTNDAGRGLISMGVNVDLATDHPTAAECAAILSAHPAAECICVRGRDLSIYRNGSGMIAYEAGQAVWASKGSRPDTHEIECM